MTMKTIIFTGGGSGGHVMPALTLISHLDNYKIEYIGGRNGIERSLVKDKVDTYYPIFTGKLRRYFSLQNFFDVFKIMIGLIQSFQILALRPANTIVFSTGGFVSVPVVIAAWLTGKKIFIHEQTSRVGLANKIASKFATTIFVSFEESLNFFPRDKTELSGYPVRETCFSPIPSSLIFDNVDLTKLTKPLLFITGGGNGSELINTLVKDSLSIVEKEYFIIHQVGKKNILEYSQLKTENYHPFEFIKDNMIDLMKLSDVIIARAGAGTVCELMALNKPTVFIPLKIAQKNEQFHNAKEAELQNGSLVIEEDTLKSIDLVDLLEMFNNRSNIDQSKNTEFNNGTKIIINYLSKS
jgi:UDP-N-acetylglucosamine--N-acetylmuramyl-(pentapeptide) pyrophosphoryl-undecaprenol N-acetylglucosamine transferase